MAGPPSLGVCSETTSLILLMLCNITSTVGTGKCETIVAGMHVCFEQTKKSSSDKNTCNLG